MPPTFWWPGCGENGWRRRCGTGGSTHCIPRGMGRLPYTICQRGRDGGRPICGLNRSSNAAGRWPRIVHRRRRWAEWFVFASAGGRCESTITAVRRCRARRCTNSGACRGPHRSYAGPFSTSGESGARACLPACASGREGQPRGKGVKRRVRSHGAKHPSSPPGQRPACVPFGGIWRWRGGGRSPSGMDANFRIPARAARFTRMGASHPQT